MTDDLKKIYGEMLLNEKYEGQWESELSDDENTPLPPDGKYRGKQSGYVLSLEGKEYNLKDGIRGINFPFNIEIKNGKILKSYI